MTAYDEARAAAERVVARHTEHHRMQSGALLCRCNHLWPCEAHQQATTVLALLDLPPASDEAVERAARAQASCPQPCDGSCVPRCWCGGQVRDDDDGSWCMENINHDPTPPPADRAATDAVQPPIGGMCHDCGHFAGRHTETGCPGVPGQPSDGRCPCPGFTWEGRVWPRPWLPAPDGLAAAPVPPAAEQPRDLMAALRASIDAHKAKAVPPTADTERPADA